MKYKNKDVTIGEVVVEIPKATEVFKKFGIDFCCGGHRLLSEVVAEQKVDEVALFEGLDREYEERRSSYGAGGINPEEMSPSVLTAYIEDTHHAFMRKALPGAADLLNTVVRAHGKNHEELFEVSRLFGLLKADLEQHLLKEETMLFPDFEDTEANREEINTLTATIIREHEAAGEVLASLRKITSDYTLPADACGTFARTYQLLEDIEGDLHQHIHLENNILLKEYAVR